MLSAVHFLIVPNHLLFTRQSAPVLLCEYIALLGHPRNWLMLIAFAGRQQRQRRRSQASACLVKPHMEGPEREVAECNAADIAQLPELALELIFSALDVRCSPCVLLSLPCAARTWSSAQSCKVCHLVFWAT